MSTTLNDVATFIRGITFKPEDVVPVGSPNSVACMRTKNVQAKLDLSDVWGVSAFFVKRRDQYLQPGDVLVSSANSWNLVGKCCWVPELPWQSTFGGFISALRPDMSKVDPRYLYRWFASDRVQTIVRSFGQQTTNISNLNVDRCLRLEIPLPPLVEQRRIATILDKADALRARRRAALAQLDALTQSVFLDMFGSPVTNPAGWPAVAFSEICDRVTVGIVVKPASYYVPNGVPALRSLNIKPGKIVLEDLVYFSQSDNDTKLAKTKLRTNDVVIVRTGQPGTAAVVPSELDGVNAIDLLIASPQNELGDPTFLCTFFNSAGGRDLVLSKQRGQVQKHLNVGSLNEAIIPLPPIDLQRTFARRIGAIEKLKASHHASCAALDGLFASLQDRAFRGEL
ncbi:MAG: restriction endonuclease subunit S [Rhodospirillales bacterium]|nr:restriction endonuclease subunit S [Rhodospirillales bacterium]